MDYNTILETLTEYVRNEFDIGDDPDFGISVNLFDYGYVDSLGAVEIINFVEERFHCEITQKDISKYPMNTLEEIAEVVAQKLK